MSSPSRCFARPLMCRRVLGLGSAGVTVVVAFCLLAFCLLALGGRGPPLSRCQGSSQPLGPA